MAPFRKFGTQRRLMQLIPDLAAHDLARERSHEAFRAAGKAAIRPLECALESDDEHIRFYAEKLLSELEFAEAGEVLVARLLMESEPWIATFATHAPALRLVPGAFDRLLEGLRSPEPQVRRNVAFALGFLRDARSLEPLLEVVRDVHEDAGVRQVSVLALGELGDSRALAPLLNALDDRDLAKSAMSALGTLGNVDAVDPLVARLDYSDEGVVRTIVMALRSLGDPRAIEPLTAVARRFESTSPEYASVSTREMALGALTAIDVEAYWRVKDELSPATPEAERAAAGPADRTPRSGPMGERYCSEHCFELGGQTVARHQLGGWTGDCSVCRNDLAIGPGQMGSMVCYKPGLFLYFHQERNCEEAIRGELALGTECVICGHALP
jgi:HEAT repeat protein